MLAIDQALGNLCMLYYHVYKLQGMYTYSHNKCNLYCYLIVSGDALLFTTSATDIYQGFMVKQQFFYFLYTNFCACYDQVLHFPKKNISWLKVGKVYMFNLFTISSAYF